MPKPWHGAPSGSSKGDGPVYVLYWAPAGHIPTEQEVEERFDHLRRHGATPRAFTFEQRFSVEAALAYGGDET
jgi:hypothetical protein